MKRCPNCKETNHDSFKLHPIIGRRTLMILAGAAWLCLISFFACNPNTETKESKTISPKLKPLKFCSSDNPSPNKLKQIRGKIARRIAKESRQLQSADGLELWETPNGPFWVVADEFKTMIHVLAEQEMEHYGNQQRGVQHGDIVLDGGAHFGGFVRKALDRGAKIVVAIDLDPDAIRCLKRTFEKEILAGTVIVYPKGIWHEDTELYLERDVHTWGNKAAMKPDREGDKPLPLTTIDNIVEKLKLKRVDFIKLDIEGAERNALQGAHVTLKRFKPRMAIAAYHLKDDKTAIVKVTLAGQSDYKYCLEGRGWSNEVIFFN